MLNLSIFLEVKIKLVKVFTMFHLHSHKACPESLATVVHPDVPSPSLRSLWASTLLDKVFLKSKPRFSLHLTNVAEPCTVKSVVLKLGALCKVVLTSKQCLEKLEV